MGTRYTERFRAAAFRPDEEERTRLAKIYAGPLPGDEAATQSLRLIDEVDVPEEGFTTRELEDLVRTHGWPARKIRVDLRLADVPSSGNQNYLAAKVFSEQRVAPPPPRTVPKKKPRKSAKQEPSVGSAVAEGALRALADPTTMKLLANTAVMVLEAVRPWLLDLAADRERRRQEIRLEFHRRRLEVRAAGAPNPSTSDREEPEPGTAAVAVNTVMVGGSDDQ